MHARQFRDIHRAESDANITQIRETIAQMTEWSIPTMIMRISRNRLFAKGSEVLKQQVFLTSLTNFIVAALMFVPASSTAASRDLEASLLPILRPLEFTDVRYSIKSVPYTIPTLKVRVFDNWDGTWNGKSNETSLYLQVAPARTNAQDSEDVWRKALSGLPARVVPFREWEAQNPHPPHSATSWPTNWLATLDPPKAHPILTCPTPDKFRAGWAVRWLDGPDRTFLPKGMADRFRGWFAVTPRSLTAPIPVYLFPDLFSVEAVFGKVGGQHLVEDRYPRAFQPVEGEDELRIFLIDDRLLRPPTTGLVTVYWARAYSNDVIIDYPEELVPGRLESRRLCLDLNRFGAKSGVGQARELERAFFPPQIALSNRVEWVELSRIDCDRLRSISLDARQASGVLRSNETALVAYSRLGRDQRIIRPDTDFDTLYLKIGEPQESYKLETTDAPPEAKFAGVGGSWPRRDAIPSGFLRADQTQDVEIRGKRYAEAIVPIQDKSVRFVLVEADPPFYIQEFEVTVGLWKRFLTSEVPKAVRSDHWLRTELQSPWFTNLTSMLHQFNGTSDLNELIRKPEPLLYYSLFTFAQEASPPSSRWSPGFALDRVKEIMTMRNQDDLPMVGISPRSAEQFAIWLSDGGSAEIPTKERWDLAVKNVKKGGFDISAAPVLRSLDQLKASDSDFALHKGGRVWGLSRNAAEIVQLSPGGDSRFGTVGYPFFRAGTDWPSASLLSSTNAPAESVGRHVGLRLIAVPSPQN